MHAQPMQISLSCQLWLNRAGYYRELHAALSRPSLDVTAWVQWFVQCVEKACTATVAQLHGAARKSGFRARLFEAGD